MNILKRIREAEAEGCNNEGDDTSCERRLCDVCMKRLSVDTSTCSSHQFCVDCRNRFSHSRGCPICGSLKIREMEKIIGKPYVTASTYKPFQLISSTSSSVVDSDDDDYSIARSIQYYRSQRQSSLVSDETVLSDSDSEDDSIAHSIQLYRNRLPTDASPAAISFAATPVNRTLSVQDTHFSPFDFQTQSSILI